MKQTLYMIFLVVCAIVFGGMLGNMVIGTDGLSWLGYAKTLAFEPGTFINIEVLRLTFGISITINVSQLILMIVAFLVYHNTAPKFFPAK